MRLARLAPVVATALLAACQSTQDSPGRGDTAVPYGGAANGTSIGQSAGYFNAAGADKNPNPAVTATLGDPNGGTAAAAAPAADSAKAPAADSAATPAPDSAKAPAARP